MTLLGSFSPMRKAKNECRLTTILSIDAVGYSRVMGEDEAGTLAAQIAHRAGLPDPTRIQYSVLKHQVSATDRVFENNKASAGLGLSSNANPTKIISEPITEAMTRM